MYAHMHMHTCIACAPVAVIKCTYAYTRIHQGCTRYLLSSIEGSVLSVFVYTYTYNIISCICITRNYLLSSSEGSVLPVFEVLVSKLQLTHNTCSSDHTSQHDMHVSHSRQGHRACIAHLYRTKRPMTIEANCVISIDRSLHSQ